MSVVSNHAPSQTLYADAHATANRLYPSAVECMREVIVSGAANASSVHYEGQLARRFLRLAREKVAQVVGSEADSVVFTSGVTESLHLAIVGLGRGLPTESAIVSSAIEHPALISAIQALQSEKRTPFSLQQIPVTRDGIYDVQKLSSPQHDKSNTPHSHHQIVALQAVNHETGAIQPLEPLLALFSQSAWVIDATHAAESAALLWKQPILSALALSSHKLGGPSGVGGLIFRRHRPWLPTIRGGHQEAEMRAGTQAVALIAGFAEALVQHFKRYESNALHLQTLSTLLEQRLLNTLPAIHIQSIETPRKAGVSLITFAAVSGRKLVESLDQQGVCASAGAACAAQSTQASQVLLSMGISREAAFETVRFSLSSELTTDGIEKMANVIIDCVNRLRREGF